MPPLSLSGSELNAVLEAAQPIPPRDRDKFLRDVAAELGEAEPGGSHLGMGRLSRLRFRSFFHSCVARGPRKNAPEGGWSAVLGGGCVVGRNSL
jgi:hypothetical protein